MSVKVMAKIWEAGPASLGDRFVLLAIADHANDEGQAFPGVGSLARKTCMTERGVQKILRRLEADGWLLTDKRQGRYNCNLYTVMTPNLVHPTGAETNKKTPNKDALDPERGSLDPERGSPKPSLTIIEPSFRGSELKNQKLFVLRKLNPLSFLKFTHFIRERLLEQPPKKPSLKPWQPLPPKHSEKLYLPMPPPSPFGHPKNCNMCPFRPPGSMVADGRTTAQRGKKSQKMA
jgi:hypothetical protein